MRYFLIIVITVLLVSACKENNVGPIPERKAGIEEVTIPDTVEANKTIEFDIVYMLNNGCYTLKRFENWKEDNNYYFDVIIHNPSYNDPSVDCTQAIYYDTLTTMVNFPEKGIHKIIINDTVYVKDIVVE